MQTVIHTNDSMPKLQDREFGFDFVSWALGGSGALLTRIVFTLVGVAGVWAISLLFRPMRDEITDPLD